MASLGGAVAVTAMPLLVLQLTGSGLAMGIVGVLGTLPDLIFGLPSGVLADRMDRRRLMLLSDVARAALTALIPLSVLLGLPTMGVILLVTFPINVFRVMFMAGWTGATPNLVSRRRLGQAVSAVESLVSLSFIAGPAVAGILVGLIGAGPTLAVDAVKLALSAASLLLIRRPFQGERPPERAGIVAEMREGMAFIATHPVLRLAVGVWTAVGIVIAGMVAAVTFAITKDRGMGSAELGFLLSVYGVGNLAGAFTGGRFTHGRLAPPLLGGYLIQGLGTIALGLPLATPLPLLLAAGAVAGFGSGLTVVSYLTYRASITPDRLLSRVGSTARTISIGLQPIGLFIAGFLLDTIGGNETIVVIGVGIVVLAGLFALAPSLREARAPEHTMHELEASGAG